MLQIKTQLKKIGFYIFPDFLKVKAVAYHEAGHAIACYRLQIPISKITINRQEDCLGYVDYPEKWKQNVVKQLDGESESARISRIQTQIQNSIVEKMCGGIAEEKFRGYPNPNGMKTDNSLIDMMVICYNYMPIFNQVDSDVKEFRDNCKIIALRLIENPDNWRIIEIIATALLKKKELSEKDFLAIIDSTIK